MSMSKLISVARGTAVGFGLTWNVVFICATLPLMTWVPELVVDAWDGFFPLDYLALLLGWLAMPYLFMALLVPRLKARRFDEVLFLFFAVEGPLCCLGIYRLIAMRELTPAVMQWLFLLVFGLAVHGADLVFPRRQATAWRLLRLVATTCLVLVGLYVSVLALLGLTPVALGGALWLFDLSTWQEIGNTFWREPFIGAALLALGVLLALSFLGVCAMPVCILWASTRALFGGWRDRGLSPWWRAAAVLGVLAVHLVVYQRLNTQPQQAVMEELERTAQGTAPERFEARQQAWREGLLNAYLAPYRYASSPADANGIAALYRQALHWSDAWAERPQALFNALAAPILYDGPHTESDSERAAALYERYFDTPIQRGERQAVLRALSATHDRDQREAGLINVDQRKVWVAEQRVQVEADGDLARVTLDETYVNLTDEPQEIFYLFSLPEEAAITKLWLGDAPERLQPHVIATRGAAQRVYKAEVQRSVDPALLEQVGPRQYRLRAYPVPARERRGRRARDDGESPRLYLRLQYVTLARHDAWPLPVLAEKRNVDFDRHTRHRCEGGTAVRCPQDWHGWWPRELPAAQPVVAGTHAMRLGGDGPVVTARPTTEQPVPPQGRRILLVVDRSASMRPHREAVREALQSARTLMAGNEVSVLLGTTAVMGETPRLVPLAQLNDEMLGTFMGGGHVDELLAQRDCQASGPADLTLVLTDEGAFELQAGTAPVARSAGMLSFVHLGGVLSPVYDDATLAAVQRSGGSSFTSLPQAWDHFMRRQAAGPGFLMQRDGYTFTMAQGTKLDQDKADRDLPSSQAFFAPMAARLGVAGLTQGRPALDNAQLDRLHAWARRYDVVTPYSSMLVLVNTQQQEALARAEAQDDRFDRSPEQGIENLRKPNNPLSASVTPEPGEWLLLCVGLGALGWMVRARRRSRGGPSIN